MKSSSAILIGFLLLAIGLAVVVGPRLSDQVIAALAGATCGIGLAAPLGIAVGVSIGSTRHRAQPMQPAAPPQVIVMSPPNVQPPHTSPAYPYSPTPLPVIPAPRTFTIIGQGDAGEDSGR